MPRDPLRSLLCGAFLVVVGVAVLPVGYAESEGRNTLVFPPGAKEPVQASRTPEPTPVTQPAVEKPADPEDVIALFFLALKAENVDGAYDNLVRGTIIAEREEDLKGLKARTLQALDSYGPVLGYEVVDSRKVGEHLSRKTCLSLNSDLPLRWRFYFYRSEGVWRLVDLRVDDGLVELFEDVAGRP